VSTGIVRVDRCLQCVAVCVAVSCNVLQCVAVCCSVLQCFAVCCRVLLLDLSQLIDVLQCVAWVLQFVAVYCDLTCPS